MRKKILSGLLSVVMMGTVIAVEPVSAADGGLLLHYSFSEMTTSQTVKDDSGKGNDGILKGNAEMLYGQVHFDGRDDYIKMPDGLLENTDAVTVAINTMPELSKIHMFTWNFGNSASSGYMFLNTARPEGKLRFAITPSGGGSEEHIAHDEYVEKGEWASVIVTIDGKKAKMYRDGVLMGERELTVMPSELGYTKQNWIGRSPYGDAMYQGYIDDFRVYSYALSEDEVKALSDEYKAAVSDELGKAVRESGLKNTVKGDITLPVSAGGAAIKWISSDESVISADGKVTRPAMGEAAKNVTITADISGSEKKREVFNVSVLPEGGGSYNIDITGEKGADISKGMIGLFFEDINYAADGGIYAEMVENRSFEARYVDNTDFTPVYDGEWAWSAYPDNSSGAVMDYKTDEPLNENNPHYLEFTPSSSMNGFRNAGYDGFALTKGMTYKGSLYAKSKDYKGSITVSVIKDGITYASAKIDSITSEWTKYEYTMTAADDVRGAELVITTDAEGTIDFDIISLFPSDAVEGVFRKDLAEMLKAVKPGFLRFPGGCVIEGYNLDNRYNWKDSVGAVEARKENWNRWDLHTTGYNHYNQTLGLGFYEYFLLCEYLECEAIPVVNVGMACQFQTNELVPMDSEEFRQYINDALDLIEFANGDTSTQWGALRAEMGHPEPFGLTMLGIGNEQWNTEANNFYKRYEAFERAIHEKYPDIKLIGTSGPNVTTSDYTNAWEWIRESVKNNDNFVYAVDEHYYMTPDWFLQNTDFYDNYDRGVNVFAGEYASRTRSMPNDPEANTLYTALTEAAYFTGLERNSDVVKMSCYAPLFARVGYTQWSPDLIWFDDVSVYGSPSYYIQKMSSLNLGDYNIKTTAEASAGSAALYQNVSYDEGARELIIKAVNPNEDALGLNIRISGYTVTSDKAAVSYIGGTDPESSNSIDNPKNIVEKTTELEGVSNSFRHELAPYTYEIIRIPAERVSDAAAKLVPNRFVQGRSTTEFEPDAPLTRAEILTMLARVMTDFDSSASYEAAFDDVSADAWYANTVGFMHDKGIVQGYGDGSFRPNGYITVNEFKIIAARLGYSCALVSSDEPITRAEAVKQLCLMLGIEPSQDEPGFEDLDAAGEYYGYISAAVMR